MTTFVLKRLGWALLVTWFVVTTTFVMVVAIPANPGKVIVGAHGTPDDVARVNAHYCLDRGLVAQYGCWLEGVITGDLGDSRRSQRPVADVLADHVWPTAQLAVAALVLQLVLGVPLGLVAAARRRRWPDRVISVAVAIAQSAPPFVVGSVVIYVLAFRLGWFPIAGYGDGGIDRLHHLVLPALTTATIGTAAYARLVRDEVVDALGTDYVRTARAKGVRERDVIVRHAFRSTLGTLVTLAGIDLGALLGGAVITETLFAWPGIGRELLLAILELDMPVILGIVIVSTLAITLANLVVDVLHAWVDPRLR